MAESKLKILMNHNTDIQNTVLSEEITGTPLKL